MALCMGCLATVSSAIDYYVAASGGVGTSPYTNWGMASSNLIEVVALARNSDVVYVTNNSTYYLTNWIIVNYSMTIRSWAPGGGLDPTNTIINGNYPATTNKHFYMNHDNATLTGFTLTNGCNADSNVVNGGSIYLYRGLVTNCIITGNRCYTGYRPDGDRSYMGGGGIWAVGKSGGVWNCTISGNMTSNGGGGIFIMSGGPWQIMNCTIAGNCATSTTYGVGGGLKIRNSAYTDIIVSNCLIMSNSAYNGGGIQHMYPSQIYDCKIIGNTAYTYGGGMNLDLAGIARNCLIANNVANNGGGIVLSRSDWATIQNCTVVSNYANDKGGGIYSFTGSNHVENTIIWDNLCGGSGTNWYVEAGTFPTFTNSCTAPHSDTYMTNTVTSDPQFVDFAGGNYRLSRGSPCINAGVNRAWMDEGMDLDGNPRLSRWSKKVDIGAYERMPSGTIIQIR